MGRRPNNELAASKKRNRKNKKQQLTIVCSTWREAWRRLRGRLSGAKQQKMKVLRCLSIFMPNPSG